MRKRKKGRKLSRKRDVRRAFLKNLLEALFLQEKIVTTEARAKEIAPFAEKYITRAKGRTVHDRRILSRVLSKKTVKKLIDEIAPQYETRRGGYTRITKIGFRKGNGARMAIIELVK